MPFEIEYTSINYYRMGYFTGPDTEFSPFWPQCPKEPVLITKGRKDQTISSETTIYRPMQQATQNSPFRSFILRREKRGKIMGPS